MRFAHLIKQIRSSWLGWPSVRSGSARTAGGSRRAHDDGFDFGDLPVDDLQAQGHHDVAGFFLQSSNERHIAVLRVGYKQAVNAFCRGRVPDAVTQVQLLAVLCVFGVCRQRQLLRITRGKCVEISINESFKACTVAWPGGCTTTRRCLSGKNADGANAGKQCSHYDYGCDFLHDA